MVRYAESLYLRCPLSLPCWWIDRNVDDNDRYDRCRGSTTDNGRRALERRESDEGFVREAYVTIQRNLTIDRYKRGNGVECNIYIHRVVCTRLRSVAQNWIATACGITRRPTGYNVVRREVAHRAYPRTVVVSTLFDFATVAVWHGRCRIYLASIGRT